MTQDMHEQIDESAALAALQWYIDNGVSEAIADEPCNHYEAFLQEQEARKSAMSAPLPAASEVRKTPSNTMVSPVQPATSGMELKALSEHVAQAEKLAAGAKNLEELQQAIQAFDAIESKKTAANLVFADGSADADIMIIGDKPEADDERAAKPFQGAAGRMLDTALSYIGLSRAPEDEEKPVYLTYLLNWRPPGNRSMNEAELRLSLPFLKRHIELASPKVIIVFGASVAQALLGEKLSIARLRKKQNSLTINTDRSENEVRVFALYSPSALLATPLQKKGFWQDVLKVKAFYDIVLAQKDGKGG